MEDLKNITPEKQRQVLFMMLVNQHEQIGMMGLGKIKNPATDKTEVDLSTARFAIDTLDMLKIYTQGNLSNDEKNYLDHTLSTLRLNFVSESK